MKKFRFVISLLVIAFCVTGMLFANGSQEKAAKAESKVTKIVYYTWDDACHKSLIDAFNNSQSEIFVDAKILASTDYEAKLTTLLSGQAEMDCYMEKRQTDVFTQNANGFVEPLNKYIAATGKPNAAVEAYKGAVVVDSDIIGIPWRGGARYTFFNKKVFEKVGIPTPDYFVERCEWTWAKFEEVSKAIHEADPSLVGSSIYLWGGESTFQAAQHNDLLISNDGVIGNVDNVISQIAMRKRLEDVGAMWSLIDMKVTKTHYSKQFYDGKLGMLIIGEWFPGQIATGDRDGLLVGFTKNDYGITRLPCDTEEYATQGMPTFNCVTAYSKNKEAAFKFIEWMGSAEGAKIAAEFGVLPAISSPEVEKIIEATMPDKSSLKYFLETKTSNTPAFSVYGSRVEAAIQDLQDAYLLGQINDQQFKEKLLSEFKVIIDTTY